MIKDSLPGAGFIESRSCRALSMNSFCYTLDCNWYKCLQISNKKEYVAEAYTQSGVCHESVKRTKTSGALSTIDAMAMKTELRAMKNQTITTNSKDHSKKRTYPTKRPTNTKSRRSESSSNKCNCQISIFLRQTIPSTLMPDMPISTIKVIHVFHQSAKNLGSAEISDQQAFILQQL